MRMKSPEALQSAIENLDAAIVEDPDYALAYSALAQAYDLTRRFGGMPRDRSLTLMEENVAIAMRLSPDDLEALIAAGAVASYNANRQKAIGLFQRALAASPQNSDAL